MPERFAALIRLYAAQEDDVRRRIGALETRRAAVLERIAGLEGERTAAAGWSEPALREQAVRFWTQVTARIADARTELARGEREIDVLRGELAEVHRQRSTFEKLAERDERAAEQRVRRIEGRRLDEFATMRRILAAGVQP